MSVLLRRVSSAAAAAPAVISGTTSSPPGQPVKREDDGVDGSNVLLPLSMVYTYLSEHSGLRACQTSAEEVHGAILRLHALCVPKLPPEDAPLLPRRPTCSECNIGYEVIDAREGCIVCQHCGLITRGGINVTPEYQAQPEVHNARKRKRGIPGVPSWLLKKSQAMDPADKTYSSYWDELQHWNAYFHMTEDELKEADRLLRWWKATGGDTREARMMAVLIYIRMRDVMPNEADVRNQLRCHRPLEAVDCGPPKPTFGCHSCGSMHHCAKGARFCCRTSWGHR